MTTSSYDEICCWRSQLVAVELCRAVSDGGADAAEKLVAHEADQGRMRELVAGLASIAVSLAKTVALGDTGVTEDAVWASLAERARTGLLGTAEIDQITTDPNGVVK